MAKDEIFQKRNCDDDDEKSLLLLFVYFSLQKSGGFVFQKETEDILYRSG